MTSLTVIWSLTRNLYNVPLRSSLAPVNTLQIHSFFVAGQLRGFNTINGHLATRTFLVGERITRRTSMSRACSSARVELTSTRARARLPQLVCHMETVINQPVFEGIFPAIPTLETAKAHVAPKKGK